MAAGWLGGLAVYPLRMHLRPLGEFRAPEYAGALFRGGFGKIFRDTVCVTGMPVCEGCPHRQTCAYSVVFETPVAENLPVLRKYPYAPHPFVLTPLAGEPLGVDITLIGKGIDYLGHFVHVFEEMGE